MTKKHFALVAKSLKASRICLPDEKEKCPCTLCNQWRLTVTLVADSLAREHERFQYPLFLKASGFSEKDFR